MSTNAKISPIVFCNIAWHLRYDGNDHDLLVNGGSYIGKHHDGGEIENFLPIFVPDEETGEECPMLLGFYQTQTKNGNASQTHIERIHSCATLKKDDQADGVTVVWCATPPHGNSTVVGWYKNATVYRRYKTANITYDDGYQGERWFNVYAKYDDAVLLPEQERLFPKWRIPRVREKNFLPFGFGQYNLWYADRPEAKDFVIRMIQQIESYDGPDAKIKI